MSACREVGSGARKVCSASFHHHILHQLTLLKEPSSQRIDQGQGFVTDTGRYVDRKEAWQIAEAAGQLNERAPTDGRGGTLYSEDLW